MTDASSPVHDPVARTEPTTRTLHGVTTTDDYEWMRHDRAGLMDYLAAERAHYDASTAHTADLQRTLFEEMSARVPASEESPVSLQGGARYSTRTVEGGQYPQFLRRADTEEAADPEVLLDLNLLAEGSDYAALGVREVSPDGTLLAYSIDTDGDEVYELRIRDLTAGTDLPDSVPRSYYGCAWSADSKALLYVVHDAAYRPYQVRRHEIGQPATDDVLIFEEADERFDVTVAPSRSGEYAVISTENRDTSEVWLVPTADLTAQPFVVAPRRPGVEYSVDHMSGDDGGDLYVVTDDGAVEFRLMRATVHSPGSEHWVEVLPENPVERLVRVDAFKGYLVLSLRRSGAPLLRVVDVTAGTVREEPAGIPAGTIVLACHDEDHEPVRDRFDSGAVTVLIESLIEPPAWWEIDLATGARRHLVTAPVPGYDAAVYRTSTITATARDGVGIPVTIAHRADLTFDGSAPCLLYGYGAYEAVIDPSFDPKFAALLDRGVVYAIAHIRGGGEGGRNWWEQGRLLRKRTTFTDFIAAADALDQQGIVDGARIATRGASAGGLLQGAVLAMAPHRWRAIVAEVPFVDVVTTMLDPSTPLTINEWDEWGDPRKPADFAYLLSYSPYDNVPLGPRPDLLATGSVNDARVMIHEPARWIARLRATRSDHSTLLFRPALGSASHGGPSGRYDRLRYQAEILSFVLDALHATEPVAG